MKKIVSFSGGRTSAYTAALCKLMFDDCEFVFMDTGFEHNETYRFIKEVNQQFNLNITCIRIVVNHNGMGKKNPNHYEIIDVNDLKCDLQAFNNHLAKYGKSTFLAGWCTRDMKAGTFNKYIADVYGNKVETWLGIRADEPSRLVGKEVYNKMKSAGYDNHEITEAYRNVRGGKIDVPFHEEIQNIINNNPRIRYLAEVSDFDKEDILDWWSEQNFDLGIDEHLGNCVFCIKKSIGKIALAQRDEPELAMMWQISLDSANPRVDLQEKNPNAIGIHRDGLIYRGNMSFEMIREKYKDYTRDEILETLRSMKRKESGTCSESCEVFSCNL